MAASRNADGCLTVDHRTGGGCEKCADSNDLTFDFRFSQLTAHGLDRAGAAHYGPGMGRFCNGWRGLVVIVLFWAFWAAMVGCGCLNKTTMPVDYRDAD